MEETVVVINEHRLWSVIGILALVVMSNIWRYYNEDESYKYSPVKPDTNVKDDFLHSQSCWMAADRKRIKQEFIRTEDVHRG